MVYRVCSSHHNAAINRHRMTAMRFDFTEEQKLIQQMLSEFVSEHGSSKRVRAAMNSPPGYDPSTWRAMSGDLGLAGLLIDEVYGGQNLGLVELALIFEALGRKLVPSPLLSSAVIGATVLSQLSDDRFRKTWLPKVATGECQVAVAALDGAAARFVLSAASADLLLLVDAARNHAIRAVVAESPGQFAGLDVSRLTMMDQTRSMSHIRVRGNLMDSVLAEGDEASAAYGAAMDFGRIAIAAEATGAARECLERTVAYTKERVQFGRPIGSFQAVKHQLADMMVALEAATSAVYFAACTASETPEERNRMAALAKVQASEALSHCAARMIQLHGGIGFTWEHDAHLYFKRARGTRTLLGSDDALEEVIADSLGLRPQREAAA